MAMLTVEEAQERILSVIARAAPLAVEQVALPQALGRVLARDAVAREALPPFTNSSMDGYAVRAEDTRGATPATPVTLRLAGAVPAGSVFPGVVGPGEAVRILTGAPLPAGADAAIQQELVEASEREVHLLAEATPGMNVRAAGGDARPGDPLVAAGEELGPTELALLGALGVTPLDVTRRPRVAILTTGDELVPFDAQPGPGQIRDSNALYLAAAVTRAGGEPWPLGVARDDAGELRAKLTQAREADLVLTSGGVSVGDYDLVRSILSEQGEMAFWRVRMRPGKPLTFGLLGDPRGATGATPLLGLPGNPVSTAVTFELFARPALRLLLGCRTLYRPRVEVTLAGTDLPQEDRRHYVRARLAERDGRLVATPTGAQGSHLISSLRSASALVIVEEGAGVARAGDRLPALLLADALPWGVEQAHG